MNHLHQVPAESPMILMLAPGIGWLLLSVTNEIELCAKVKLQKKTMSKYTLIGYNLFYKCQYKYF
jgi:hypothetical protein